MPERIEFRFDGQLSSEHRMDFYEAGRFQYGAARLLVKLDQFRQTGRFSQKITYQNNTRITLSAQGEGSFVIAALAPLTPAIVETFISTPISLLWSYVVDRVVKPANDSDLRQALQTSRDLIETFNSSIAQDGERNRRTLDLLENRIARGDDLSDENTQLRERLLAETERRAYLQGQADALERTSPEQDARLISMASPLLKDMGVALRSSASTLEVTATNQERRRLLFLNRSMASEIETSVIDDRPTVILVHIVQYNTETGWGKFRMRDYVGLLSFNVPSDVKPRLQRLLTDAMNEDHTYIECVFARSARGLLQRAIILSIIDIEEAEGGIVQF